MSQAYLVRYGAMSHVGRFVAEDGAAYRRGDVVIVRSRRGTEMAEVLASIDPAPAEGASLLRAASPEDFDRARRAAADRDRRYAACAAIFRDGQWPFELIDVEPLLDDRRTVLHYLGPHRLDASGLFQLLRDRCGLDVIFEPVGRDAADDDPADDDPADDAHGCGSCGEGGGCGTGCGADAGGCSGCSVKDLVRATRPVAHAAIS